MTSKIEEAKHLFELGLYFFEEEDFSKAEERFKEALRLAPDRPSILVNLSATLIQLGKWEECEKACQKILSMEPSNYDALLNLSVCLSKTGHELQALEYLDQAIAIDPHSERAWTNKGNILQEIDELQQAAHCFDRALQLNSQSQEAHIGRGNLQNELKAYRSALEDFDAALEINPFNSQAKWNKALSLLRLENFEEGWKLFEARWQVPGMREHARYFTVPLWLGKESLHDKTILIHAEQGYGDTIQMCRYLPILERDRGTKVIFAVPTTFLELMSTLSPTIEIIDIKVANERNLDRRIDYYCPVMSLPLALGTRFETIPNITPYLNANIKKRVIWRERLNHLSNKFGKTNPFQVGITLMGSGHYAGKINFRRNVPFELIESLLLELSSCNIEFHSLHTTQDSYWGEHHDKKVRPHYHARSLSDFSDTAALIEELDLIISIDTASAHLAGALGKPVLILLPDPPDFMSPAEGEKTPWYPSATLFRQHARNDWGQTFADLSTFLKKLSCPLP